ncbi:MAG TPA: cation diffusion facilitator family transporter [Peptococcaceae bacterium]|nr:cation diffusion facilitator family transporter [Peptococcaceae bacterium]HQD53771.1 cation diffusion facilitator family transporter [Peptococcaceae bacterium]
MEQDYDKESINLHDTDLRERYGKISSFVGIFVNVFLFAIKLFIGRLFHSVAVTADAVNNLSDAGSSVISLVSFKLAGMPADKEHPFGHERIEYLASSVVGFLIIMLGVELLKTSFEKILHPDEIVFSMLTVGVLLFSIVVKFFLYFFNMRLGKRFNSSVMKATAVDSLSDVLATSSVLLSTVVSPLIGLQLDGYMGVAVSILIMISGINILREMLDTLLGEKPAAELVERIENAIKKYDGVLGVHDLVIHSYGPRRFFATAHVEVDAKNDVLASHDLIDNIEREVEEQLNIHLVLHMDPLTMDDPDVNRWREMTKEIVAEVNESLSMHDFRVVKGVTHTNLIFDVVVPYQCQKNDRQVIEEITQKIQAQGENLFPVITIDRSYV